MIWLPILDPDRREKAPHVEMQDQRIAHLWDDQRIAGRWLFDRYGGLEGLPGAGWDTFYLFGQDSHWGDPPVATGHTILNTTDQLTAALRRPRRAAPTR